MNGHAFLAPSKVDQWSVCLGARALEEIEGIPQRVSQNARYGTKAHALAEAVLNGDASLSDCPDQVLRSGVQVYVDFVLERARHHRAAGADVELLVEKKVPVSCVTTEEGATGTADALVVAIRDGSAHLEVIDLKFGTGVNVPVENNGQLLIYAAGALEMLKHIRFDTIDIVICQPRVEVEPRIWHTTPANVHAFAEDARRKATVALSLRGSRSEAVKYLNATEKGCMWCTVKKTCTAYQKMLDNQKLDGFDDVL